MATEISSEKISTNGTAAALEKQEKVAPRNQMAANEQAQKQTPPKETVKETSVTETKVVKEKGLVRRILPFVFFAILIAGAIYGYGIVQYNKIHETTDDAQIDADISPIIPRVAGYVKAVAVADNDKVNVGDVLVTLDVQDLQLKVQNAQAAIVSAEDAVRSAEASAQASQANIATAQVAQHKTATDLERDRTLLKGNAITQQMFDITKAAAENAEAQLSAVQKQAAAAQTQIATAQSVVAQRKTDLANAQLQSSYSNITAPVAGTVAKKNVVVGQFIQPGQPLMAIAQGDLWISANFKETQISDIKVGQSVEVDADAYPNVVFHGTVQSISPATGAKFALLPPDNASGNFVKVTQRIPVKILLTHGENPNTPLRPGMSVNVSVKTGK